MKKRVGAAVLEHGNQYPPMFGVPEARQVSPANSCSAPYDTYEKQVHADL